MKKISIVLVLLFFVNAFVFANEQATLKIYTSKTGNIFFEGEIISFSMKTENMSSKIEETNYVIKDENNIILSGKAEYSKGITIKEIPFGVYDMTVTLSLEDGSVVIGKTEFSYVKRGEQVSDSVVGMCTHFAQNKGDIDLSKELLYNAGVAYIRDDCSWSAVEQSKGIYTIPEKTDYYVDSALNKGIKTLLVLAYGNSLYDGGLAPFTNTGRTAFANYAKAVAEHFKGKVDTYEVWNEWNGGFGNPQGESAAVYTELLKVTYTALKSVDPNIKVVAGATITNGTSWFREMLEAGGLDYCDAISYHPYCYPQNPDVKDYRGNIEDNYTNNLNLLKEYGGEKEIWITEYGWHTSEADDNVTKRQQAEYLVRSYVTSVAYGVDKLFWYDFQNDGVDASDRESEFGVIKCHKDEDVVYAAKPAYVALSAMNGLIGDAEYIKEYRPIPTARFYHFRRKSDGRDVVVAYNAVNADLDFKLLGNEMECYDMYGNPCEKGTISDKPIYLIGKGFKGNNIVITERSGVFAQLGATNIFDGIRGEYTGVASSPDDGTGAWEIDENSYIGFDIDDSYICGYDSEVEIEVTYYDYGQNSFCVEYGDDENVKSTEFVSPKNTTAWKTKQFVISGGHFANGLDGQDFRIKTLAGEKLYFSKIVLKKADRMSNKYAKAVLSEKSIFDKLSVRVGDKPTEVKFVVKDDRIGWETDIGNNFLFLYGDIENTFLYGTDKTLTIEVDYFDEGNGKFTLQYNSDTDSFIDAQIIELKDTKEWKTAVFNISKMNLTKGSDFRIALWSSNMGISAENICFGGINVINSEASEDFNINFDFEEKKIDISGYSKEEYITVEILNSNKTEEDLVEITADNVDGTIVYVNMIKPNKNGFFSLDFKQEMEKGIYIVRMHYPQSHETVTKILNYFDCYEVNNVKFMDRDNVEIVSLEGANFVRAKLDFTVYKNPLNGNVILACYDESNRLKAVDVKTLNTYAQSSASIIIDMDIPLNLTGNAKVKMFFIKDFETLQTVHRPEVFAK